MKRRKSGESEIIYTKSWNDRSTELLNSGKIKDESKNQLFNLAWKFTSKIIISKLAIKNNDIVFDAGFGLGRVVMGLKYYLPELRIDGVELTDVFAKEARTLLKDFNMNTGVNLEQGDLINYELEENKYDAFYSTRVLHYIWDKEYVLSKLYKSLKKGGKGLIIIPNRYCPYQLVTYKHAPLYSIHKVKQIMEKVGYKNVLTGGYGFIPPFIEIDFESPIYFIEYMLERLPIINYFGGLGYAVGKK